MDRKFASSGVTRNGVASSGVARNGVARNGFAKNGSVPYLSIIVPGVILIIVLFYFWNKRNISQDGGNMLYPETSTSTSVCEMDCSVIPDSECVDGECTDPYYTRILFST
jgi:hypothetical protein